MADKTTRVGIDFVVRNKATQDLRAFQSDLGRAHRQMVGMFRGIGVAIGLGGLTRAFKSVIDATMEQERAERILTSALRLRGDATNAAIKDLQRFASAMQQLTIYGDEEIMQQMAYASNLGVTTNQLKEAAMAAAGLAAKYEIDLASAMMLVGRASQGQTQLLTRYGIVLDQSLTPQQRFNELLKIGREAFNLAAEATQDATGAMAQLANTWSDTKQALGEPMIPAVTEGLTSLNTLLTENQAAIKRWANDTIEGIRIVIEAWKAFAPINIGIRGVREWMALPKTKPFAEGMSALEQTQGLSTFGLGPEAWRDIGKATVEVGPLAKSWAKPMATLEALQGRIDALAQAAKKTIVAEAAAAKGTAVLTDEQKKAEQTIADLTDRMSTELLIIGKLNHSRARARDLVRFESAVRERYAGDIEEQNRLIAEFETKLGQLHFAELKNAFADVTKMSDQFTGNLLTGLEDAILQMRSFGDVGRAVLMDLARMMMRQFITAPLYGMLSGAMGSVFGAIGLPVPAAHRGGEVGRMAADRVVPAWAFAGAPRLHSGLASDEVPTILQRGETVIPRGKSVAPNVVINVKNETGTPIGAETTDLDFDGEDYIVTMILNNFHRGSALYNLIRQGR